MSMRHHWAELDALLAEVDEAARFQRGRPQLAAVAARGAAAAEPPAAGTLVAFPQAGREAFGICKPDPPTD